MKNITYYKSRNVDAFYKKITRGGWYLWTIQHPSWQPCWFTPFASYLIKISEEDLMLEML